MKNSSNLNISCKVVFSLNKWNKNVGSPSSFGRKRPFISLNSSASIRNLSSCERARARARANHAKKWCAERMRNAIEWNHLKCARKRGNTCPRSCPGFLFLFLWHSSFLHHRMETCLSCEIGTDTVPDTRKPTWFFGVFIWLFSRILKTTYL